MYESYETRLNHEREMARMTMTVIANCAFGSKGKARPTDFWQLPWDFSDSKSYTPQEITDIYLEREELIRTGKKTIL